MKKTFLIFFTSLALLFLIFNYIQAQQCDESNGGKNGIIPCGRNVDRNGIPTCPCKIDHIFLTLSNIFNFIVKFIATPLAILMMTIGGILIIISAGNPNWAGLGKKALIWSIIGLALVFGSWVIVNFILGALGYKNIGTWNVL